MPCAPVLSAGRMFGAYQAGAWEALAERFQPGLVVGAAACALNAWAIAGGCSPDDLCDIWTQRETADLMRVPRFSGRAVARSFDAEELHRKVDEFYARFRRQMPYTTTIV